MQKAISHHHPQLILRNLILACISPSTAVIALNKEDGIIDEELCALQHMQVHGNDQPCFNYNVKLRISFWSKIY